MNYTLRWILVVVTACFICSAVTYHIAQQRGYRTGFDSGLRDGAYGKSLVFLESLRRLRAGDTAGATRFMEQSCFISAHTFFINPNPKAGEPNPGAGIYAARPLAKELAVYRAAYRTNSADWDGYEQKLEVQLAQIKSADEKAWDSINIMPENIPTNNAPVGP